MTACPKCGCDAPDGATICPECGTELNPRRRGEERRTVTTLFCDLVGFTALSERHDPELVNAYLRRYYAAARRVIESYGGTVEKFIGDAVVAVFGVPTLHEDDPERALRAGLRLVDEVDALPGIGGQAVEIRVGVNTGEALVRLDVDPSSGEGFLTGDAVNVAARLQCAAPPMTVAVGDATHAATEKVFTFDACHPVALKGKSRPLQAWIATAPLARTGSELRTFSSNFVGREDELAALERLLGVVSEERKPRFGLIVGEPGIGKSRLLAELSRRLDDHPEPITWRQGRCLPFGSNVTFWALSEIVRSAAAVLESDGVARTEARLETVLPDGEDRDRWRARLRPLLGLDAEEASREENFSAWRGFVEGLATAAPAVLVVEDLHWADEAMLAFMDYLAQSGAEVPLLVIATGRPEVLGLVGPGAGFVATAAHIAVGPLSGEETAELARSRLGTKSLPADLQALILERSGGNPLFAEELVRLLEDRDLLANRDGRVALKAGADVPLPDSIGALIASRLDLLTVERKTLLANAAVVGRTFWAGAVAAIGGLEPAEVMTGLMELVAKELVSPVRSSSIEGETEFLFVHALVCDVAYEQLTRADRAAKHAALARWLEGRTAGRTEDLAEVLAYHYGTALDMAASCGLFELEDELSEPTTRYLEMAGGRAAPLDASAAAAHFARAERVADEAAKPKRRWLLSRRARRTLRRRAPLLVAAAAVVACAGVAALAIWAFAPAKSGAVKTMSPAQIAAKYGSSVVRITTPLMPSSATGKTTSSPITGSGFMAAEGGWIITSSAVVQGHGLKAPPAVDVEYALPSGAYGKAVGRIAFSWRGGGIAVIKVDPNEVKVRPLTLGDSDSIDSGEPVVSLGMQPDMVVQQSTGEITKTNTMIDGASGNSHVHDIADDLQSAKDVPRNEPLAVVGGPLFDSTGGVIGVVGPSGGGDSKAWGYSGDITRQATGIYWAISAVRVAGQMGVTTPGRTYFGVTYDWLTPELAQKLGQHPGALVEDVTLGSPADLAGIVVGDSPASVDGAAGPWYRVGGDVIVSVDGVQLTEGDSILSIINHHKVGDVIPVQLWRGGQLITIRVRLTAAP
jgi:class 3 adenylate cyclase/S1-C subfamily serine protease